MKQTTQSNIKALRARGWSQSRISRETGIPQPRLSRWESGDVPEAADDALRLAALVANPTDGIPHEVASAPPATKLVPTTTLAPTLGDPRLGSDRREDERRRMEGGE